MEQCVLPIGNCVNSFDEEGNCLLSLFCDVSDFACVEEESEAISQQEFQHLTGCLIFYNVYLKHKKRGIFMGYNEEEDIHYFYGLFRLIRTC